MAFWLQRNIGRSAFFWINNKGQVFDINDYACQSLGYSREELLGQYIWFFDPDFSAESWPTHWAEQKKKLTRTFESRHQRKDRSVFPVPTTFELPTNTPMCHWVGRH